MSEDEVTAGEWSKDAADIQAVVSDDHRVIDKLRELGRNPASMNLSRFKRTHNLEQAVVSVYYLRRMVDILEEGGYTKVLVEMGTDTPVQFTASGRESNTIGCIAPQVAPEEKEKLLEAQQELGDFQTECLHESCDWQDTYEGLDEAKDAGREHRYFEGHQFKVYSPLGKTEFDSTRPEEVKASSE